MCPTEIIAFSDRADEFRQLGADLVAVSCDSHFSHLAWTQTPRKEGGLGAMKIPVMADFNKKIAQAFGVLEPEMGVAFRSVSFNRGYLFNGVLFWKDPVLSKSIEYALTFFSYMCLSMRQFVFAAACS